MFEKLCTVVVEIESTLNTQPLSYIYDGIEGICHCLTPADLIYDHNLSTIPNDRHYDATSTSQCLMKRARHQFKLFVEFKQQWRRDHLLSLRECSVDKNRSSRISPTIKKADVVILKDEYTASGLWILARVTELFLGRDNQGCATKIWVLSSERKSMILCHPIQVLIYTIRNLVTRIKLT